MAEKKLIDTIIDDCYSHGATDIHIGTGHTTLCRVKGKLIDGINTKMNITEAMMEKMLSECMREKDYQYFKEHNQADFAYTTESGLRLRANAYYQREKSALALRILQNTIPTFAQLNLPAQVQQATKYSNGIILVTGPTGSGKSTTLAAMLNEFNETRQAHILTLEDPIEYVHPNKKSLFNQREIGTDTESYATGLKAALRQDPDIILVGEMRDNESIEIALQAAATGHLVLSTLHTLGAAQTINRIVDVFPVDQQQRILTQLAGALRGVISQKLVPKADGTGRVCATEVMYATPAIQNNIGSGNINNIKQCIETSRAHGMYLFNNNLIELVQKKVITPSAALDATNEYEDLVKRFQKDGINIGSNSNINDMFN